MERDQPPSHDGYAPLPQLSQQPGCNKAAETSEMAVHPAEVLNPGTSKLGISLFGPWGLSFP